MNFISFVVAARLEALSQMSLEEKFSPEELVKRGYCDPVRLFVKQEPHPRRKIEQRRFRLISSVSLADQLVERLLFGYQNRLEIAMWQTTPSKPGMGLSLVEQSAAIWRDLVHKHSIAPACEADISGFDWSVQEWELRSDVEMRIALSDFPPKLAHAARARFHCLANSVFQLSNGEMISQGLPGLMKSGSYCTSSTNSRIRCLMAKIIDAPWCIAMGDDSVEGYVENAKEKYEILGHECKDYIACEVNPHFELKGVNFCSHYFGNGACWLTSWPKTLVKFFSSPDPRYYDLSAELNGSPNWAKIRRYVRRVGLGPDKDGERKESQDDHCKNSAITEGCGDSLS